MLVKKKIIPLMKSVWIIQMFIGHYTFLGQREEGVWANGWRLLSIAVKDFLRLFFSAAINPEYKEVCPNATQIKVLILFPEKIMNLKYRDSSLPLKLLTRGRCCRIICMFSERNEGQKHLEKEKCNQ